MNTLNIGWRVRDQCLCSFKRMGSSELNRNPRSDGAYETKPEKSSPNATNALVTDIPPLNICVNIGVVRNTIQVRKAVEPVVFALLRWLISEQPGIALCDGRCRALLLT